MADSAKHRVRLALVLLFLVCVPVPLKSTKSVEQCNDCFPLLGARSVVSAAFFPRYFPEDGFSHLRRSMKKAYAKIRAHSHYHSSAVLLSGDVERNPGPPEQDSAAKRGTKSASVKKTLKIVHLNARSILRHLDDVQCLVKSQRPDILAISESWLGPSVSDAEVTLPGYTIYRLDRSRSGGGIAVYVVDHLTVSPLSCDAPCGDVEALWLSISSFKSSLSSFAFGCMYRPPSAPSSSVSNLCSILESLLLSHKHVVACGDLNIDTSDSAHPFTRSLQNFITSHSLSCPISHPTRVSETRCSVLDHFLTSSDVPISHASVLNFPISDHLPIILSIDWSVPNPPFKTITRRSLKKFEPSSFNEDLIAVPWSLVDLFDDVDDKVFAFNSLFSGVLDCHAPVKTVRVKKNCAPWISRSIRKEMDKRNKLLRVFLGSRSPSAWNDFKRQRNLVVSLQRKAKIEHFQHLISKNSSPATLWKTLKSVRPLSTSSSNWDALGSDHTSIANSLNDHFVSVSSSNASLPPPSCSYSPSSTLSLVCTTPEQCERSLASLKNTSAPGVDNIPSLPLKASKYIISRPLSNILNSSISSSTFPSSWKCSSVRPLHKGGNQACLSNYRPISILPACSKLLERHVRDQVTEHLDSNNLLYSYQSGFRSSHSTQSLLLYCTNRWYQALDLKQYVAVLFLDVSKAFDTVNHPLLLSKLRCLGLDASSVSWFQSYLSDRSQVTRVSNSTSSHGSTTSGVPQGSVLGPTLFSLFINDLPTVLPPDCTVLFADDTTIFLVGNDCRLLNTSLQSCLDLANKWLTNNGLQLNVDKTKCMLIRSPRARVHPPLLHIHLSGSQIEQVSSFKLLGVLINDTLTWTSHINHVVSKVSRSVNLLRRLSWFLPQSLLVLYLKSYILPLVDYCDVVWDNSSQHDASRLQNLFNYACRLALHRPRLSSSSALWHELGLSSLCCRRKLHLAELTYKCHNSLAPSYLSSFFCLPTHHHNTRTKSLVNLPVVKTMFGQHAFAYSGASLWRSLPASLRESGTLEGFSRAAFHYFVSLN